VTVEHRAVIRLVQGATYARFAEDEVFLQLAPLSFDASTFELWGALLNGARLVVAPAEPPSLIELGRLLRREGVTTLWLTAELFHQMVDEQLEDLRGLRQLLAGGDVLSVAHVERMRQAVPSCRLINGYGPTENTTFTTCHPVQPGDRSSGSVPIGRPISNTRVYVLDEHLQPVPIGVRGELYAGGDGVARGYLDRPDLTAERFVPDPFSGEPGARLYRTGDLARWRADGSLEFLGRLDHQVKVRGYRIELGEIEAVLARHPAVGRVVVLLLQDARRDPRLVAYVVAQQAGGGLRDGELQEFLQQRLPDYMVPSTFVLLDSIPVTPTGKVDRLALPAPDSVGIDAVSYVAPRSPVESVLAEIWEELLHLERVGVHDNFFALGGHSLKATQVISHVRARLGVELPLSAVFEAPTVAGLAALAEAAGPASLGVVPPPLVPASRAEYRRGSPAPVGDEQE
jgi:aspartate racemase